MYRFYFEVLVFKFCLIMQYISCNMGAVLKRCHQSRGRGFAKRWSYAYLAKVIKKGEGGQKSHKIDGVSFMNCPDYVKLPENNLWRLFHFIKFQRFSSINNCIKTHFFLFSNVSLYDKIVTTWKQVTKWWLFKSFLFPNFCWSKIKNRILLKLKSSHQLIHIH